MQLCILAILLLGAASMDALRARRAIGFDCSNKAAGDYADPSSPCSGIFYKCSPIGVTLQNCPAGTAYDTQLRTCNWLASIPQCSGQTISSSSSSQSTTVQSNPTSVLPAGLISFSCNQNPSASNASAYFDCFQIPNLRASLLAFDCLQRPGSQQADIVMFDCFQKTIAGGNSAPVPLQCRHVSASNDAFACSSPSGLGLGFECRNSGIRSDPSQPLAFGCVQKLAPSTSTSTIQSTSVQSDVPQQFNCNGKQAGNYPMGPCENHFWQCANGVAFLMPCATLQQRYNPSNDRCLNPIDVAGCRIAARKRRQAPAALFSCAGKTDGDYAAGQCQDLFYTCSNGQSTQTPCAQGTVYDSQAKQCQWQDLVAECQGGDQNDEPSTTTQLVTSFSCDGKANGDYANPDQKCSKYFFKCSEGRMSQEWCPADLLFDSNLSVCNYPQSVVC